MILVHHHLRLGVDRPDIDSTTPFYLEVLKDFVSEEKVTKQEIHFPYPDVPVVNAKSPTQNSLLLEKISAVCDRNRPRDMHDVYRLLRNGASVKLEEGLEKATESHVGAGEQTDGENGVFSLDFSERKTKLRVV